MTYAGDLRWRAIVLGYIYGMDASMVGTIFGSHERSVRRWITRFEKAGSPCRRSKGRERSSKWPRQERFTKTRMVETKNTSRRQPTILTRSTSSRARVHYSAGRQPDNDPQLVKEFLNDL
ncbi:hypothetical protein F443_13238 [Phytophthora nicotianae P1569]|uniref:Uncharacterized protein n=1 Tax=Phytophthora nicotianae P1569 TaxID=1317065 RepID=V9ESS1_PHYNI|nr:hypothetical protein F443_13238 [Phytophthora nicotianae P1569]